MGRLCLNWQCLSRTWSRVGRCFSSVDTPDAEVAASQIGSIPFAKQQQTRPIFPWRHEKKGNILPRFVPGTEEYLMAKPYLTSEEALAYFFLGIPFLDSVFFKRQWKEELSENMAFAFMQGVSAIISNTFEIPVKNMNSSETVKFAYDPEKMTRDIGDDVSQFDSVQYNQMIAAPLRELFQSAHKSGRDQLRIILETKAIESRFLCLYGIPCLTRDEVERDRAILREVFSLDVPRETRSKKMYNEIYSRSFEKFDAGNVVSGTVAAEVYIVCEEKFQVVDAQTGVVLQGSEGIPVTQQVGHVVTFEMEASSFARKDEYPEARNFIGSLPGNWQITDIDDLLSVKKWYHM